MDPKGRWLRRTTTMTTMTTMTMTVMLTDLVRGASIPPRRTIVPIVVDDGSSWS